jgi:ABC-type branched-subunit amino acid transport system ATPase component
LADSNASSLEAFAIRAGYGSRDVISAVSLSIASGEVLGLLGHNGAGKSTLLKTLAGVLPLRSGDIRLGGHSICRQSIAQRIALGVTYLPQGNPVFPHLSVNDNLRIRVSHRADIANPATVESVLESFPKLKDRLRQGAGSLSGGEKQMLSLAGALLSNPRFLLLDEPSLGLAPSTVTRTLDRLRDLARTSEVGILVVEQKAREALRVCDRLMVMKQGRVTYSGRCGEEMADTAEFRELCL